MYSSNNSLPSLEISVFSFLFVPIVLCIEFIEISITWMFSYKILILCASFLIVGIFRFSG